MTVNQLSQKPEDLVLAEERDEIEKLLGNPPGWTSRWGISAIFLSMLIFMGLAWLIKYPDVIPARVSLQTENPAIRVIARKSGKIARLLVENDEQVRRGQLLGIMENTAFWEDVKTLDSWLSDQGNLKFPGDQVATTLPEGLQLGELQMAYTRLIQTIKDYRLYGLEQHDYAQIRSLQEQISYILRLNESINVRKNNLLEELRISGKNLDRQRQLFAEGVISEMDLEAVETEMLRYQRQLENLQAEILHNNLQIEQLQAQAGRLESDGKTQNLSKRLAVQDAFQQLKVELENWRRLYLISAPIAGRVAINNNRTTNQYISANEVLATIVPGEETGKIVGMAALPVQNSGKVRLNMPVHIQLDAYAHRTFGLIEGQVSHISLLPEDGFYALTIKLPQDLSTTFGKQIPFSQELSGTAKIITEDRRILERIFDNFISLLKN